jgi:hypothetical protein
MSFYVEYTKRTETSEERIRRGYFGTPSGGYVID